MENKINQTVGQKDNGITELVFILDRSGSMAGMEDDTIGGFNAMIEQQKQLEGKVYVSTVLFSNTSVVIHDRVDLQKVEPLTRQQYQVNGCTALLDAIGGAMHHIKNVHKYARKEDVPTKTLFFITTDGMENASRTYSSQMIKERIRRHEEHDGWEFVFVAANIDAVETADHIGIRRENAENYDYSPEGTRNVYECMSARVSKSRANKPILNDWADGLKVDKKKKKD